MIDQEASLPLYMASGMESPNNLSEEISQYFELNVVPCEKAYDLLMSQEECSENEQEQAASTW